MNLLKIGTLNIPKNRWEDALIIFNKIFVVCFKNEKELLNKNIIYLKFDFEKTLNSLLLKASNKFKNNKYIMKFIIFLLRVLNIKFIDKIRKIEYEFVHSSYNDFDESGILTLILSPYFKWEKLTRAYKENRPEKNYIEEQNFKIANRIIFNSVENKDYFIKKYKNIKWGEKTILINLDEDYRQSKIIKNTQLSKKLSTEDGQKHIVILAGRVMSDESDKRSGTRLYYVPLIKELINSGLVVHLHTIKIINDSNNVNQYEIIKKNHPKKFFIEEPLDFENKPLLSYQILSQYNYGILHNISNLNNYVSVFDKINIPHRFYEYQIAEVIPVLKKGDTVLMERLFNENNYGLIYEELDQLIDYNDQNVIFLKKSFSEYINELYKKDE